jgi:hypothetical protein
MKRTAIGRVTMWLVAAGLAFMCGAGSGPAKASEEMVPEMEKCWAVNVCNRIDGAGNCLERTTCMVCDDGFYVCDDGTSGPPIPN